MARAANAVALDPQIQMLVDNIPGGMELPTGDPLVARQNFHDLGVAMASNTPPADLAAVEDREVPGARGAQAARIYRPHGDGPFATILFFHGGGFVVGDVASYDVQARYIAEKTGAVVLSSDYGLAPENAFPDGLEDVISISRWALENVDKLGGDAARVAIAGDSAGGNLAAATAQALAQEKPGLAAQILLYPVVDFVGDYPSRNENADGPVLTKSAGEWFGEMYTTDPALVTDPRMSPIRAESLAGLPPAVVATAGFDPLRDEGDAYADALATAGVSVKHLEFATLPHGFVGLWPLSPGAADATDDICDAIRELLG